MAKNHNLFFYSDSPRRVEATELREEFNHNCAKTGLLKWASRFIAQSTAMASLERPFGRDFLAIILTR
jgi:hypothetical protein